MPRPTNDVLLTKIARVALCIQRGGGDSLGDVDSIHGDFTTIIRSLNIFDEDLKRRLLANAAGLWGSAYVRQTPLDQLVKEIAAYCFHAQMEDCQLVRDTQEAMRYFDAIRKDLGW